MRFELYTDKTVKQCLSAVNDRLQAKSTSRRPDLDGWIEKGGRFSLAVSTRVARRFKRKTRLHASVEREDGTTVIRGAVPSGVDKQGQAVIFGALLVIGLLILSGGDAMLAIFAVGIGAALYVPLRGDLENSEVLMKELKKTLKAKENPPKSSKSGSRRSRRKSQSRR